MNISRAVSLAVAASAWLFAPLPPGVSVGAPLVERASTAFVSGLDQIEGNVNPLTLNPYVDESLVQSPGITVNGDGTFTMVLGYQDGGGWFPAFGWEGTEGNFISSATGWTWETRFRIDAANDANRGVWEIYLRDNDGGQVAQRIHFLSTGIDRDNAGFGVSAEIPFDFMDDFHVVRASVDANNRTSVWIDGNLVIDDLASSAATGAEYARIGRWGGSTRGGTVTIDYIRFDTTGAYAPAPIPEPSALALVGLGGLAILTRAGRRRLFRRA